MKRLWLYYFPLLFLPNLGFSGVTQYGSLELSDLLIGPYLLLVLLAAKLRQRMLIDRVVPLMAIFVAWALVTTLLIDIRYGYTEPYYVYVGLLKLGKFVVYAVAGLLTIKALVDERTRRDFARSLLVAGMLTGAAVALINKASLPAENIDLSSGYKASNQISVLVAIMGMLPGRALAAAQRFEPLGP